MRFHFTTLAVAALLLSGCASSGVFETSHLTNVQLTDGNYSIIATNISGEASASYILGASGALGNEMRAVALARVDGERLLYQAAFENLWQNFEAEHGSADGRALALINVRYDSNALNLVLFTRPQVSIRADVVEFE